MYFIVLVVTRYSSVTRRENPSGNVSVPFETYRLSPTKIVDHKERVRSSARSRALSYLAFVRTRTFSQRSHVSFLPRGYRFTRSSSVPRASPFAFIPFSSLKHCFASTTTAKQRYVYVYIYTRARGNVDVMAEKCFLTLCTGKLAARFIREIYIFFARVPKGKFLSRANAPGADATEESLDTASYSKKEKFHIGFSEGEAISRRDIDYLSPGSRFVKNRSNRPCDLSSRTLIRCPRMDD